MIKALGILLLVRGLSYVLSMVYTILYYKEACKLEISLPSTVK